MLRKNIIKILILVSTTFFLVILSSNKVHAADFNISNAKYSIDIDSTGNAKVNLVFTLKNTSKSRRIINSYELFLPFYNAGGLKVTINGKNANVQSKLDKSKNFYKVDLLFGSNVLTYNESAKIKVDFKVFQFLRRIGEFRYIKVGDVSVDDPEKFRDINITFPQEFNEPTFKTVSEIQYIGKGKKLEAVIENNRNKSIILGWGDNLKFSVNSSFNLLNDSEEKKQFIFQLIPQNVGQKINYSEIDAGFGLYDNSGNNFATVNLEPKTEKLIEFMAQVDKTSEISGLTNQENLATPDYSIDFWKNVREQYIDNFDSSYEKLFKFYASLIKKYGAASELTFDPSTIDSSWGYINKAKSLNSFYFSYAIKAFCKEINIKCEINYGYKIFPLLKSTSIPNFWVKAEIDGRKYIIDAFSEILTGVNNFNEGELDRIVVGVWDRNQEYNNALGLIGNQNKLQTIEIKYNAPNLLGASDSVTNEDFEIETVFPSRIYSGFYYEAKLKIKNNTNKVFRLNDIAINNNAVETLIQSFPDLNYLILPQIENEVVLGGLREPNFFSYGQKNLNVVGKISDGVEDTMINKTVNVNFQLHDGAWMVIVIIFNVIIIALIYSTWKFYLRKRL